MLAVLRHRHMGCDGRVVRALRRCEALVCDRVLSDIDRFTGRDDDLTLRLEEPGSDDPDCDEGNAQMDDVPAVASRVAPGETENRHGDVVTGVLLA